MNGNNLFDDHNILGDEDLLNQGLTDSLGDENTDLGIENSNSAYADLITVEAEELSLIEETQIEGFEAEDNTPLLRRTNNRPIAQSGGYINGVLADGDDFTGSDSNEVGLDAPRSIGDGEAIAVGQTKAVSLAIVSRDAGYRNEVGLYRVDDAVGRIGNLSPGDNGYAAAALDPSRRVAVLDGNGTETTAEVEANSFIGSYLIQNSTSQRFLLKNSSNNTKKSPVAFFSFTNSNPDGVDHVQTSTNTDGSINLAWEDLTGGGDRDYNDLVANVSFSDEVEEPPQSINVNYAIVAEGKVTLRRGDYDGDPSDLNDDARIYAGSGFSIAGKPILPVQRDEAGNAIVNEYGREILVDNAVTVAEGYSANYVASNNRYTGLVPPQVVDAVSVDIPEYAQTKQSSIDTAIGEDSRYVDLGVPDYFLRNARSWAENFPAPGTIENPTVVRIDKGGLTIPNGVDLSNYVIVVGKGDIKFKGRGHELDNVVLVAENDKIELSKVQANDSSFLAAKAIKVKTGNTFTGDNLIANGKNQIEFTGFNQTVDESDNLKVIAGGGNLSFRGMSELRGEFLTAKDINVRGKRSFYGSLAAKGDIFLSGKVEVYATSVQAEVTASIDSVTVNEENEGTVAELTVSLSAASTEAVSIDYATRDDSAVAVEDYQAITGTVNFNPGEVSKTIEIPIVGDNIQEGDEAFEVSLSNAVGVTLADDVAVVNILNDDLPPEISIDSIEAAEGDGTAELTVSLSAASSFPITVDYATSDGEAVAGSDYTATNGTLTFEPGETSKVISVSVLNDGVYELTEGFSVELTNPSNATVINPQGTITLTDDDSIPALAIENVTVTEGDEETATADFVVTLSQASGVAVSLDYNTVDGTAKAGSDYQAVDGTLTFEPGETSKVISVSILGDVRDEIDEAFSLNLNGVNGATLVSSDVTGTIVDNDESPSVEIESITVTEGESNTASLTLSLSAASSKPISVDYDTEDETATAGSDYTGVSGTVTFEPGTTVKTIEIPILDDNIDELTESFVVRLSNAANVTVPEATAQVAIVDNDEIPSVQVISPTVTEGNEGTAFANFTVNLDRPSSQPITISFATEDGTAVAGADYVAQTGTITVEPGQTTANIAVEVLGDIRDEVDEAFNLNILNVTQGSMKGSQATATIIDDDAPPEAVIGDVTVTEGDDGTNNASFTVELAAPSGKEVTIDYSTVDGSAIAGADYVASSGTITFAPGETTLTIDVAVLGDTLDEIDEAFSIELNNPSNVTLNNNSATATISDNDELPSILVNDLTVTEGDDGTTSAIFTVNLSDPSSKEISVDYATADGTAIAGLDYVASSGTLTFAPGETSKEIAITVTSDNLDEIDEAFALNFVNASNAVINEDSATATIIDNDNPPELTMGDISVTETDDDTTTVSVTVSLATPSSQEISVDYATANGTAVAGLDYVAKEGTITFAPGETTLTIDVEVIGDVLDELDEAFSIDLSNPSLVTLKGSGGQVTIVDNDQTPEIAINSLSVTEGNEGKAIATFTVNLSQASSFEISVDYTTEDGTAEAGSDYVASNGTITLEPGSTSKTISVEVTGDSLDELDETFGINLTNPNNATVAEAEGIATIVNDDNPPELLVADINVVEGNEGTAEATFTVNLSNPSSKEISVDYATADGGATAGSDYIAQSGTLTFAPGETSKEIAVTVTSDNLDEIDEALIVNFDNGVNVTIDDAQTTATIVNDDNPPEVEIGDIDLVEGDEGTTIASVSVSLNNPSSKEISVDYATVDGTAEAGLDYTAANGTITFAPGSTSKTIEIEVIGDNLDEIDEAFAINLSNPSNVTISDGEGWTLDKKIY